MKKENTTFDQLKRGNTVFCVTNIEDGHAPMTRTNPYTIKEHLFFESVKELVGIKIKLNTDEKGLNTIHSDTELPNVQPKAFYHENLGAIYCTSKEVAEEELKKLIVKRIGVHEDYIRALRKEYYDVLNNR